MTNANLQALAAQDVSIWLDDLSRERLSTGNLKSLIDTMGVVGVTTNPSIFQAAISDGDSYAEQLSAMGAAATADEAVFSLTTTDVADACDVFADVFAATDGRDGRVSIEVDPRLARDTAGTVTAARALVAAVDRPNVLIKIPATTEGIPAIADVLAEGISVNVTLLFSLDRYRAVMNAYLEGLERARANGHDLATIRSVASLFVSRVDTLVDARLDAIGTPEALNLRGKAGLANARLTYQAFEEVFSSTRWESLAAAGAHVQRPLWASTGVKNPDYPDTMYVTELVAPETVNTMPEKTLAAVADHGVITGNTIAGSYADSAAILDALAAIGIDYTEVTLELEAEGVTKFEQSWTALLEQVAGALAKARA